MLEMHQEGDGCEVPKDSTLEHLNNLLPAGLMGVDDDYDGDDGCRW